MMLTNQQWTSLHKYLPCPTDFGLLGVSQCSNPNFCQKWHFWRHFWKGWHHHQSEFNKNKLLHQILYVKKPTHFIMSKSYPPTNQWIIMKPVVFFFFLAKNKIETQYNYNYEEEILFMKRLPPAIWIVGPWSQITNQRL